MRNLCWILALFTMSLLLVFLLPGAARAGDDADARAAIALALAIQGQANEVKSTPKHDCPVGCPCGCADGAPCTCHQQKPTAHTYQLPAYRPSTYQWVQPSPYFRAPMSAFPPRACRSG